MAARKLVDWTPSEHLTEACHLLDVTVDRTYIRATGNPPIGLVLAGIHAQIAQAKATVSVIGVKP
jgi:hypothetical protein